MSHAVTITRTTTTTTSSSAVFLNTGYLKTVPGLLKLAQLVSIIMIFMWAIIKSSFTIYTKILGAVCCFLIGWEFPHYYTRYLGTPLLFFLIVASACLIGTFCLLVSCLISLSTGGKNFKSIWRSPNQDVIYYRHNLQNNLWVHLSLGGIYFILGCFNLPSD